METFIVLVNLGIIAVVLVTNYSVKFKMTKLTEKYNELNNSIQTTHSSTQTINKAIHGTLEQNNKKLNEMLRLELTTRDNTHNTLTVVDHILASLNEVKTRSPKELAKIAEQLVYIRSTMYRRSTPIVKPDEVRDFIIENSSKLKSSAHKATADMLVNLLLPTGVLEGVASDLYKNDKPEVIKEEK